MKKRRNPSHKQHNFDKMMISITSQKKHKQHRNSDILTLYNNPHYSTIFKYL